MPGRSTTIHLHPKVLRWARNRARLEPSVLARKIGVKEERLADWEESGTISIAQVRKLAHHTHTPLGFLYLESPKTDELPIDDFRTIRGRPIAEPSVDLLETVHIMLYRQSWMRENLIEQGGGAREGIGGLTIESDIVEAADYIRSTLQLERDWAAHTSSWTDALASLRHAMDRAGFLVFINGIVGNNPHRKLDTEEFRGFALADDVAPLVFVNGADFRTAQIFSLAHEMAHLFIGVSGVSNLISLKPFPNSVERFCNQVAAEFLVPEKTLKVQWARNQDPQSLAGYFRVSRIVIAIKALELGLIDEDTYQDLWDSWYGEEQRKPKTPGGNFWNNQHWKIDPVFGQAVVLAARSERLLYRDAYSLLGLNSGAYETYESRVMEQLAHEGGWSVHP